MQLKHGVAVVVKAAISTPPAQLQTTAIKIGVLTENVYLARAYKAARFVSNVRKMWSIPL